MFSINFMAGTYQECTFHFCQLWRLKEKQSNISCRLEICKIRTISKSIFGTFLWQIFAKVAFCVKLNRGVDGGGFEKQNGASIVKSCERAVFMPIWKLINHSFVSQRWFVFNELVTSSWSRLYRWCDVYIYQQTSCKGFNYRYA